MCCQNCNALMMMMMSDSKHSQALFVHSLNMRNGCWFTGAKTGSWDF